MAAAYSPIAAHTLLAPDKSERPDFALAHSQPPSSNTKGLPIYDYFSMKSKALGQKDVLPKFTLPPESDRPLKKEALSQKATKAEASPKYHPDNGQSSSAQHLRSFQLNDTSITLQQGDTVSSSCPPSIQHQPAIRVLSEKQFQADWDLVNGNNASSDESDIVRNQLQIQRGMELAAQCQRTNFMLDKILEQKYATRAQKRWLKGLSSSEFSISLVPQSSASSTSSPPPASAPLPEGDGQFLDQGAGPCMSRNDGSTRQLMGNSPRSLPSVASQGREWAGEHRLPRERTSCTRLSQPIGMTQSQLDKVARQYKGSPGILSPSPDRDPVNQGNCQHDGVFGVDSNISSPPLSDWEWMASLRSILSGTGYDRVPSVEETRSPSTRQGDDSHNFTSPYSRWADSNNEYPTGHPPLWNPGNTTNTESYPPGFSVSQILTELEYSGSISDISKILSQIFPGNIGGSSVVSTNISSPSGRPSDNTSSGTSLPNPSEVGQTPNGTLGSNPVAGPGRDSSITEVPPPGMCKIGCTGPPISDQHVDVSTLLLPSLDYLGLPSQDVLPSTQDSFESAIDPGMNHIISPSESATSVVKGPSEEPNLPHIMLWTVVGPTVGPQSDVKLPPQLSRSQSFPRSPSAPQRSTQGPTGRILRRRPSFIYTPPEEHKSGVAPKVNDVPQSPLSSHSTHTSDTAQGTQDYLSLSINELFRSDPEFLNALEMSQVSWDSDMETEGCFTYPATLEVGEDELDSRDIDFFDHNMALWDDPTTGRELGSITSSIMPSISSDHCLGGGLRGLSREMGASRGIRRRWTSSYHTDLSGQHHQSKSMRRKTKQFFHHLQSIIHRNRHERVRKGKIANFSEKF